MKINRPVANQILTIICCFILIAACAPLRTEDIYVEHRRPEPYSIPAGHEGYVREQVLVYPPHVVEVEQGGRLLGDVEPEPEATKAEELKELERLGEWEQGTPAVEHPGKTIQYDFPVTVNKQVQYYLDFFTGKHRKNFAVWLARSGKYLPMIQENLRAAGLPEDLAYLAMIESGFNERAYSRARAVGVWQFIKSTGHNYGLVIDSYVDERRNPEKSTKAAVSYLSDLYDEFGSWYLAVAAYNAGEGKIRRAIKKYNTTDFWEIAQGRYLKLETKRYVPKLIAAIIIAKDPLKYGFENIDYQAPLAYETVEVPRWTSIKAVALACSMEPQELKKYNNELRKEFTPPGIAAYPFKVPTGKKDAVEKNLPRVQAIVSTDFKTHTVRNGETLSSICRKYGLTKTVVLKSNSIGAAGLQAGQRLRIPYQTTKYEMLPEGSVAKGYMTTVSGSGNFILHKVRPGETVSELSRSYNVPVHLIAAWNDLDDISRIRAGQQMVFYVQSQQGTAAASGRSSGSDSTLAHNSADVEGSGAAKTKDVKRLKVELEAVREELHNQGSENYYIVRNGDTLWEIGRKFDLDSKDLIRLNGLGSNMIHPGDRLLVRASVKPEGTEYYYRVRKGDSLWNIARSHNVSPEDIISWNNLHNSTIHPGNRLRIMLAKAEENTVDSFYRVRSGDSLWSISRFYNVSPEDIKRWNNLKDNTIHPGNQLLVKQEKGG